jgi:2-oxoglutarate ferredoxin oxidoreductase subunit beta
LHSGDTVRFRSVPNYYDPTDRARVIDYLLERQGRGEVVTGLLYVDESVRDMHEMNETPQSPLVDIPYEKLCPGGAELGKLMERFR